MAKAVIAATLIPFEKDEAIQKPVPPKKHWYRALFQQMLGDSPEDFKSSAFRLHIVTFNYDRSLEYYFFKALGNSFNESQAIDLYKHLRITHVYGSLGKPHFIEPADADSRPFVPAVTKESIQKSMNTMKLIVEVGMPNSITYVTGDLFLDTKKICFLGFGYDSQNIRRLVYDKNFLTNKEIYGTAYHLPESKKRQAAEEIPGIQLGGWDDDVLTFLDHNPILE